MKTIQVTMDEPLLERLDRLLACTGKARSAFIREAVEEALATIEEAEMDRRHAAGYERFPPRPDEFDWPVDTKAWEEM